MLKLGHICCSVAFELVYISLIQAWEGDIYIYTQTFQLLDWIGPVERFGEKKSLLIKTQRKTGGANILSINVLALKVKLKHFILAGLNYLQA